MPFSWYHPDVPRSFSSAEDKAIKMYERELLERAALLFRLGYSQQQVLTRRRGNHAWDFELQQPPLPAKRIKALVTNAFKQRGLGGGPPELDH